MGGSSAALDEIEHAIDTCDDGVLGAAVDSFVSGAQPLDQSAVERVCRKLRGQQALDHLVRVADAGLRRGLGGRLWSDLMQCLIEQGAYTAAAAVAEQALGQRSLEPEHRTDLFGLTGRMSKDLFFATGEPEHLRRAVSAYAAPFEGADEEQKLWLSVNVHALSRLAERHEIAIDPPAIESQDELFLRAVKAARSGDPWAIATEIEAGLVLGVRSPEHVAEQIAGRLADASPFVYNSMLRQLQQVWELSASDPAVATLAEMLLGGDRGRSGEVVLPSSKEGYEKMFDGVFPIPLTTYKQGLRVAESVCHLQKGGQFTIGTGFVVAGDDLHPAFRGRRLVITNEHVIARPERNSIQAHEVEARFDAHDLTGINRFRAIWWSDREELDIAILVSEALDQEPAIKPLTVSPNLPVARTGAYVYVVGHPGGAGLQLSVRGNDLIDQDGRLLHYLAPTQKGSSGSPVFDDSWGLIGTHHRGSATLSALNGKPGRYEGNEGTTFLALKQLLTQRRPEL